MPDRETLAQQIRELTRLIGQVSGYDSILGTHNMCITSRNSGPCLGHDNQERRIPASAVLTAARLNGSGSCGSSSDGYSTGESPPNATHTG